jgi:hypothetical protein
MPATLCRQAIAVAQASNASPVEDSPWRARTSARLPLLERRPKSTNCAFFSAARNSREPRPCDGDATSNAPVPKRSKQGRHSTPARGRNMAGHQLRCSRSRRWQPESSLRAPPELSQFLVSYPIISISNKDERRMPFIRDLGQKANGLI